MPVLGYRKECVQKIENDDCKSEVSYIPPRKVPVSNKCKRPEMRTECRQVHQLIDGCCN